MKLKREKYHDFREVPRVREHEYNAKQSGSRAVLPTDAVTMPDLDELDKRLFDHDTDDGRKPRRSGDVVFMTDRERLVLAATKWLQPPMTITRVAQVLKDADGPVRKLRDNALNRLRRFEKSCQRRAEQPNMQPYALKECAPQLDEEGSFPDWDEIDRYLDHNDQSEAFNALRWYVGEVLGVADRQRVIIAALHMMSPPMDKRRLAVALCIEPSQVRRDYSEALNRMRLAPPRLNGWEPYHGKK